MQINQKQQRLATVCALLLLSIGIGLTAGAGTAQSLPAEYYGEISSTEGELPGAVQIEVVADGEVQDSVITEADGTFGGPTAADQDTRLAVQGDSQTSVTFQIDGDPVEIATLNGEEVNQESIQWNRTVVNEIELEAEAEQVTPSVNVEITDAPSTVDAGQDVPVDISLENTGEIAPTDEVQLITSDDETVDSTSVTLGINESTTTTLSWTTTDSDAGEQTLDVEFAGESDSTTVTVESTSDTEDGEDGGNGGGGGGGGGGGAGGGGSGAGSDTGGDNTQPATTQEIRDSLNLVEPETSNETALEDTDADVAGLTVVPNANSVQRIRFNNQNLNGTVSVTEYGTPPQSIRTDISASITDDVGNIGGEVGVISVTDISPTVAATEDSSATVELAVDRARVNQTENLAVFKESYSETAQTEQWEELETNITETTEETVTIEAEVESFSLFTVAEVTSSANSTDTQTETTGDSEETADGIPGFGSIIALVALVSTEIIASRRSP